MKRIAVFCDGTWNSQDQADKTNVAQLAVLVRPVASDGVRQRVFYYTGVGVAKDAGWLEKLAEKVFGGTMGWGLDGKIAAAYVQLCENYDPGDEIYVFGFSRGAYTARSLVGLIRNCGLPRAPSKADIEACLRMYRERKKDSKPDEPKSLTFRKAISPEVCTSPVERDWRAGQDLAPGHLLRVAYLGVWDTVGSLGIPAHWGISALFNGKYEFHDTDLSSMVSAARHAVAIDERRRTFTPTVWRNLPELRAKNPQGDYRQEWFAGNHGSVGGGGDIVSLSALALGWIADGARQSGLEFDADKLQAARTKGDFTGALFNRSKPPGLVDRALAVTARWRDGPEELDDVASAAIRRCRVTPLPQAWGGKAYAPPPLARVKAAIGAVDLDRLRR